MLAYSSQIHGPPVRQLVTLCPQSVYRQVPLVIDFYAVWDEPHFASKSFQGFTIINPIWKPPDRQTPRLLFDCSGH